MRTGSTLARLARMETRRPEEVVSTSLTGAAGEDPLRGLPRAGQIARGG